MGGNSWKRLADVALSYTPPGWAADQAAKLATGKRLSKGGTLGLQGSDADTSGADEQKRLEAQRKAELAAEAEARAAAKRRAETAGSRAGASSRALFTGGLGFGSGTAAPSAKGSLFGN